MVMKQNKLMKLILYLLGWGALITVIYVSINLNTASAAPGRIAYWELNEASGTSFADSEAGQHTASCTNCPTPTTGEVSGGQAFDGSNDTITVPAESDFNWSASDSFTIELWMKGDCASTSETFIGRGNPASGHWSLGCSDSNSARFSLRDGNSSAITLDSTKTLNDGRWHHISASYDGTSGVSTLHIDGSDTISTTNSFSGDFAPSNAEITIGQINSTNYFDGTIDEVAIHNVVLPTTELNTHYYLSRAYNASCDSVIPIMPLGDSITQGFASGVSDLDKQISYRRDLWQLLETNDYSVDFVGSRTNGEFYQPLDGFDPNHEGWPGWRDDEVAEDIYNNGGDNWLTLNPAEVILLHIGTNGMNSSTTNADDVEDILNEIDEYEAANNTSITVILALIINRTSHSNDVWWTEFNANVQAMAQPRIANGDKIIIVDMEAGAGLTYTEIGSGGDFYDYLHPFETGYTKMATIWFDALETFMPQCLSPIITTTPESTTVVTNDSFVYRVEATGGPEPTYSITSAIPTGMSIDADTGIITWTPTEPGDYDITVQATNDKGDDDQSFTIEVRQLLFLPALISE